MRRLARDVGQKTSARVCFGQLAALILTLAALALVQVPLAAETIAEATTPPPPSELVQFRTLSSRTFDNHDGTYTTSAYSGRIHYRDDQGVLRPISSQLVPSQEPGYAYENEANSFRAFFKSQLDNNYLQLALGSDAFLLSLQDAAQSQAQTRARGISYPGVFPGADLRYELQPDGLKETLLLANAQVPLSYHFLLSPPPGARIHAVQRDDGSWAFYLARHARPVFVLDAPWASEADEPVARRAHAALAVSRQGADFVLDLTLDGNWLRDPGRQFPVRVDPTITIQPPFQDASFDFACPGCAGVTSDRLSIGTVAGADSNPTWRSALQFSLADIPDGASISSAKLKLYFDGTCLPAGTPCGGTSHQIDALRMTNSWSPSSKSSSLAFDTTPLTSFTLPNGAPAQWMNWDITSTVQNWYSGAQSNFGLLLKRSTEPFASSGPKPPSRNYAAEPTLGPKLEVTYNGDGGQLLEPETVHSNGAELHWIPYSGPGAPPFDSYEVHRSSSPNFTPSESTQLTKIIGDPAVTSFRDTTAKPGATFTYKVVVNGYETNRQTVTMPADGQARKLLRPDAKTGLDSYITWRSDMVDCTNRGALDRIKVGTDAVSIRRSLLSFDLSDIAPDAPISDATLSLWHPDTTTSALTVRAHRLTGNWQEGTGTSSCTGDGATWYETTGGVNWAQNGGDFDPAVTSSLTIPNGSQAGWSQWSLTSLAQQWANGSAANMGLLLKLDDETLVPGKSIDFYSSDFAVAPTLRPKLSVTYADGNHAVAPTVSVTKPSPGVQVSGSAVQVTADAFDDRRVDSVEFFADGTSIGTDTSAPYSATWNSTTVANGSHSLTARATDDAGNQTTSAPVSVTVGNSAPPTTSITSPTGGSVTGTVTVNANASDDLGVTKVEFYADGVPFATDTSSPYSAAWNTLDPALPAYEGAHTLTTKAYDAHAQVTTSAPVTVTAANAAGTPFLADFSSTTIPPYVEYRPGGQSEPTYPVDVTITNRSAVTWSATDIVLRYRWFVPGQTTSIFDSGNTSLGTAVLPGGQVTRQITVSAPTLPAGVARAAYVLSFDLYDLASSTWFTGHGNKPLEQTTPANQLNPAPPGRPIEPLSAAEKLGIEPNFQYDREQLGLGMENLVNVATGNSVVRWVPLQSPGQGLSTVVQLTYNSLEGRCEANECPLGNGWSLAVSSLTRFGKQAFKVQGNRADLVDADGTLHIFDKHGQQWDPRPGTHWYLREDTSSQTRHWLVTTPNRVTYFYDCGGNPTFARDKNGNELTFVLDDPNSCSESKQVLQVKDAAQRTFTLAYYSGGIHNKRLKSITDHSGHMLEFIYDAQGGDHGNLVQIVEHGALDTSSCTSPAVNRCFNFTYEPDGSQRNRQLLTVVDPLSHATSFDYVASGAQEDKLWKRTDRMSALTTFDYAIQSDPGTNTTTVTAPPTSDPRITIYSDVHDADRTQGDQDEGLIDTILDAANRTTSITWTNTTQTPTQPLRHVWKVTEPGNRTTTFTYNDRGLMTDRYDPLQHHIQLVYLNVAGDGGFTSDVRYFTDARGKLWTFVYDANNVNLVKIVDPGHTESDPYESFDYYSGAPGYPGAIFHATDGNGHITTYDSYDANGLATWIRDPKDQVTRYVYDADGRLLTLQDPRHGGDPAYADRFYKTVFEYDAYHRLIRSSEPKSTSLKFGTVIYSNVRYDLDDNVLKFHQPDYGDQGDETTMTYDSMDRRTQVQNPEGEKTAFAYDTAGRLTQVTRPKGLLSPPPPPPPIDPSKDYSTEYRYDHLDRVVSKIEYDADGVASRRTHSCYDTAGDLRWVTAPRAGLTDARTDCPSGTWPNCPAETPPSFTTRYCYDEDHRVRSITEPVNPPTTPTRTRTFDYDNNDNLIDYGDERGTHTTYAYTARNELETKTETFIKSPLRPLTTRYVYDRVGNMTCTVSPRAWDSGSRCTDQANPGDYVTQYRYDEVNQLERIALPDKAADTLQRTYIHRRYDGNGNLTLTTLPVSNAELGTLCDSPSPLCSDIKYYDPGWIFSSNDHVNATAYFDYEAEGWQASRQACDTGCKTTTQKHYADGLLASVKRRSSRPDRDGDGLATYTYDADNNVTSALAQWTIRSTEKSSTLGADYNGFDEPIRAHEQPNGGAERDTFYTYDPNGNVATRLDNATAQGTNGRKHEFTYDEADQLTQDYDWLDQTKGNAGDQRTTYAYKLTGWEDLRTVERLDTAPSNWQTKLVADREYFDNGDLMMLNNSTKRSGSMVDVEHHDLTYLAGPVYMNGNRVQDTFKLDNPSGSCWTTNCTTTYTYGPRDELTSESNSWRTDLDRTWTYNDQLNPTTETIGTATHTFTYDGNRLRTKTGAGGDERYLYDADGNLDCTVDIAYDKSTCPPASNQAMSIDSALKADYTWDFLNRLDSYRTYSSGTLGDHADYEYDALNRLLKETATGAGQTRRTCFNYVGLSQALSDERRVGQNQDCDAAPTVTKSYGFDADLERTSMTVTGTGPANDDGDYFFARNVHGDPSLLLTSAGGRKGSYGYSAYGDATPGLTSESVTYEPSQPFNPYRFNDRRLDSGSGSEDMGGRRYSTSIGAGRFLQQDGYEDGSSDLGLSLDPLNMNRYAFGPANPLSFVELDGHRVAADGGGGRRPDWRHPVQLINPIYSHPDTSPPRDDDAGKECSFVCKVKGGVSSFGGAVFWDKDNPCSARNLGDLGKDWTCTKITASGLKKDAVKQVKDCASSDWSRSVQGCGNIVLAVGTGGEEGAIRESFIAEREAIIASREAVVAEDAAGATVGGAGDYGPFYRLLGPHNEEEMALAKSGQLDHIEGGPNFGSAEPTVDAYRGSLPEGKQGYEFTTPIQPRSGTPPWLAQWRVGQPGVTTLPNGRVSIPCTVTRCNLP